MDDISAAYKTETPDYILDLDWDPLAVAAFFARERALPEEEDTE